MRGPITVSATVTILQTSRSNLWLRHSKHVLYFSHSHRSHFYRIPMHTPPHSQARRYHQNHQQLAICKMRS